MTVVVAGFRTAYNFKSDVDISKNYVIENNSDTLFVKVSNPNTDRNRHHFKERFDMVYVDFENNLKLSGKPRLYINKSNNGKISLEIVKEARGMNKEEALENIKDISFTWQQDDSLLSFNRYFQLNGPKRVRGQELNIYLNIPVGKTIYLGKHIFQIAYDIDNIQGVYDGNMTEEYWIMTEDGLSLLHDKTLVKEMDEENLNSIETEINEIDTVIIEAKDDNEIMQMKEELDSM